MTVRRPERIEHLRAEGIRSDAQFRRHVALTCPPGSRRVSAVHTTRSGVSLDWTTSPSRVAPIARPWSAWVEHPRSIRPHQLRRPEHCVQPMRLPQPDAAPLSVGFSNCRMDAKPSAFPDPEINRRSTSAALRRLRRHRGGLPWVRSWSSCSGPRPRRYLPPPYHYSDALRPSSATWFMTPWPRRLARLPLRLLPQGRMADRFDRRVLFSPFCTRSRRRAAYTITWACCLPTSSALRARCFSQHHLTPLLQHLAPGFSPSGACAPATAMERQLNIFLTRQSSWMLWHSARLLPRRPASPLRLAALRQQFRRWLSISTSASCSSAASC